MPVLVLEVVLNVLLGVLLKELTPMKIARLLMIKHGNLGITATIDDSNCILVGLGTISHETYGALADGRSLNGSAGEWGSDFSFLD